MKKTLRIVIQIGISFLFLYLALKNVHFEEAKNVFYSMNISLLLIGTLLHFCSFFVRAYRWQLLMEPIKKVHYSSLFQILSISYAANNVLPLRAGDLLRSVMIGNKERVSKVSSLSTVMIERLADGLTLLLFLSVSLLLSNINNFWVTKIIILSLAGLLGVILLLSIFLFYEEKFISKVESTVSKKFPKLTLKFSEILEKLLVAFNIVKSRKVLTKIALTSLFVWFLESSIFSLGALALGIDILDSLLIGVVCVSIVNLGTMIPSSPGYVGTFEFFCILALALFGISNHIAASYSILIHILQYVPITIIGCLLWISVDMKHIKFKQNLEVR